MRIRLVGVLIAVVAGLLAGATAAGAAGAAPRGDLTVPRAKLQSLRAATGSTFGLKVRIRNASSRRVAGRSVVRLLLSRDNKRGGGDRTLQPAAARSVQFGRVRPGKTSRRRKVTLSLPASIAAGPYYVLACADGANRVKERSERNNCRAVATILVLQAAPGGAAPNGSDIDGDGILNGQDDDADGDGVPNAADCLPLDAASHPGAQDDPDPAGIDRDCDGIDGHPVNGKDVFVWSGAPSDLTPGTRAAPRKTLQLAVALADVQGGDVYAATGDYIAPTLHLRSGVSIYGGYDPQSWKRSNFLTEAGAPATVVVGGGDAIYAEGVSGVEVQLLRVKGQADINKGRSVYGIRATDHSDLVLDSVDVRAGNALAPFGNGAAGVTGAPGAKGGNGVMGLCDDGYTTSVSSPPYPTFLLSWTEGGEAGGPPGAAANADGSPGVATWLGNGHGPIGQGGTGGFEGSSWAWDGEAGTGSAPGGLGGDTPAESGANGAPGPNATSGSSGAGGTASTSQAGKAWAGVPAQAGGTGQNGGYGGGGGGGTGNDSGDDGSGGGGGAGGQGGKGGTGGQPGGYGGGSFGIYVYNQSNVTFEGSTRVTTGNGGKGGTGGSGGQGGSAGQGGQGGKSDCSPTEVGYGGNGGNGGKGGAGGTGGGGAGGPSIGVMLVAGGTAAGQHAGDFTLGYGGAGGFGGHAGAPGSRGSTVQG